MPHDLAAGHFALDLTRAACDWGAVSIRFIALASAITEPLIGRTLSSGIHIREEPKDGGECDTAEHHNSCGIHCDLRLAPVSLHSWLLSSRVLQRREIFLRVTGVIIFLLFLTTSAVHPRHRAA